MFAIPGLACLLVFMYLRPQEYYTILQKAPLLYLFFAAAVGGLIIDIKLRLLKPLPSRTLYAALVFYTWLILNIVLKVPSAMALSGIIAFTIVFVTYVVISQSVQSFRAFRIIAGTLAAIGVFLAFVGFHQGSAPHGCLIVENHHLGIGQPDGRECETVVQCLGVDAEPGTTYECQRIGIWGTTALDDRVRYRGELQDPNELSLAVAAVLPLLIGFSARKRRTRWKVLMVVGAVLIFLCIVNTQSRGGMLIYLAVLGVYFVKKYGVKYVFVGVFALLPMMALGGRGGAAASESTRQRYEAWDAGLQMFMQDPVFGVGQDMFTQYHYLTAHNSYVLPAAELGIIGFILWVSVLYLSIKVAFAGVRDFANDPRAGPARDWGMAMLGMAAAYVVQMMFLSLTYHTMTWVWFGLCGAYYSAVKSHAPEWTVKFGVRDVAIIVTLCVGFLIMLRPLLILKGF